MTFDCPESSTCPRRGQYGPKVCAGCIGPTSIVEFKPGPWPRHTLDEPTPRCVTDPPVPKLVHGLDGVGLDRGQVLEEMWKQPLFVTPPNYQFELVRRPPAIVRIWGE